MEPSITRRTFLSIAPAAAAAVWAAPAEATEPPKRAGGPHLRVGCCAYSYREYLTGKRNPPMTLEDFLNAVAEAGADGVELTAYYFPEFPSGALLHKLVRRAFLLGLDINGTAVGNRFTLPPGEERNRQIRMVKRWIDYSSDLGAPCMRIFAGAPPKNVGDEQALQWVVECCNECCEYAAARGVMLALENHGGVVATPDGVLRIMRAVPSEWFGMKLDGGNFHTPDPYADLARCAPWAITTHIKTEVYPSGRRQPADLARIVRILRSVGYRGYLHLEYEGAEDALVAVPRFLHELAKLTG
ncbi:MAG: sugar phosphate isomerase/epimerase family protein [Chthonomonadales bacterium]